MNALDRDARRASVDRRILENNLYGVDLNDETIEICQLSLPETAAYTTERYELQTKIQHRLLQAFGQGAGGTALGQLNQEAQQWWTLSLNEMGQALKTSFKLHTSPFKDPRLADQWESYLAENRAAVDRLTRSLADAEADLNDRVYALFHLTPDEIKLLQREVEH
jgi:hypothetical protein